MPPEPVAGIDHDALTPWFDDHVERRGDLRFELIAGGRSNLTYRVADDTGVRWVLRRPPLGQVLATAHDVAREHRLIDAMTGTDIPVPPLVGLSADDAVNDAPFYVMEFVDGTVARDAATAQTLDPAQRQRVGRDLVEVLARLHAIDPDDVGLGDLARKDDYIGRQLRRWMGQFEKSTTRDLPLVAEVHDRLAGAVPAQSGAGIVHGDYRLDNCIIGPDGTVRAVLDWELCTLGEVRADLGLLMVYWAEPGDSLSALEDAPTLVDGFASRADLEQWYVEASGGPVADLDYFVAFSYWRLACILEGVYSRYVAGVMGDTPPTLDTFARSVEALVEAAHERLGR